MSPDDEPSELCAAFNARDESANAEAEAAAPKKVARTKVPDELAKKWAAQIERARRGSR